MPRQLLIDVLLFTRAPSVSSRVWSAVKHLTDEDTPSEEMELMVEMGGIEPPSKRLS